MKEIIFSCLLLILSSMVRAEDYASETLAGSETLVEPVPGELMPPIAENPDVEAQVAGEYPPMHRQGSLPLGAIQHAWDRAENGSGVYRVNFNPGEVIKLITREFMTSSIVFPVWEKITEIIVGDESAYEVSQPKPNILIIRPREFVGVDSSLTALGESGHVYPFYLRSEGYNSKNLSDISVHLRVPAPKYALSEKKSRDPQWELAQKTDYLEAVIFDPARLDFGFSMSGDRSIAPERVFSDGTRTWFDYGDRMGSQSLPTIYAVIDGVDTPINVSREGQKLVAQATGTFSLKSGQKITCVYPTVKKGS